MTPHKAVSTLLNADLIDYSHVVKLWKIHIVHCPVSVLLAIAIQSFQCFALFTCFQILHKI